MSFPLGRYFALPALVAALALPTAAAQADTFCVGAPSGCHGVASASLQAALDDAAALPGADRVELDGSAPVHGFTIIAGNVVELVGVGEPTIEADGADPVTIDEPQATVSGVDISTHGSGAPAPVQLRRGTIAGSSIVNGTTGTAVRVVDGTLRTTRVASSGLDAGAVGVLADGGTATLEDTSVESTTGILADAATLTLNRVRVKAGIILTAVPAGGSALRVTGGSTVTVDDSAFALAGTPGDAAIDVRATTGATAVTLRSVTVQPDPHDNLPAIAQGVRAACSGGTADVELLDTVVSAYATDLVSNGPGCVIDRQHAAYATAEAHDGAMIDAGSFLFDVPVLGRTWVEPAPTFGSVLIDHSSGRPVRAGETDLRGLPRVVDGWRDIGAYEYQHRAPQFELEGGTEAVVGSVQGFVARGEDPDRDPVTIAWTLDGTPTSVRDPSSPSVFQPRFTSLGHHVVGLTVKDASGLGAQFERDVEVVPKPGGDPPAVGNAPVRPAVTATLLSRRLGSGTLRVRVTCRRAVACAGAVGLTAKYRRVTVRLGYARFRVGANGTAVVRVPVRAAARRSLRRHRGLTVRVAVLHASGWPWVAGQGGRVRP